MITVLISGVLLTAAYPAWQKLRATARANEAKIQLELVAAGIEQLAWDTGKWPSGRDRADRDAEVWVLTGPGAGLLDINDAVYPRNKWRGPYLPAIPKDPWGSDYFFDPDYRVAGQDRVVVGSFGPNKAGRNLYDHDDIYIVIQ